MFLEHWHDEKGPRATLVDERDKLWKTRLVGGILPEVRDMNALLSCRKARERNVRAIGLDNQRLTLPLIDVCRLTVPRDRAEGLSLTKEEIAKLRLANVRGARQHCSKYRFKLARGT